MENFGSLFLWHGTSAVDLVEKLAVLAVLHEDVDFAVPADDLVDLGDVLVHQVLLQLDLPLDGLELLGLVLVHSHDLDCHCFPRELVDRLFDLAETPLADSLLYVVEVVLSS